MTLEPAIVPRIMGVQAVEYDMDRQVEGISGENLIHECAEFAPPPLLVHGSHIASCHFQGGKQVEVPLRL